MEETLWSLYDRVDNIEKDLLNLNRERTTCLEELKKMKVILEKLYVKNYELKNGK